MKIKREKAAEDVLKWRTFDDQLYRSQLVVAWGSWRLFQRWATGRRPESAELFSADENNGAATFTFEKNRSEVWIFFPDYTLDSKDVCFVHSVIAHEALHYVFAVLRMRGVELHPGTGGADEAFTFFLEWAVTRIHAALLEVGDEPNEER